MMRKMFQFSSDLHLERGFKRDIFPKSPNLILGGDIGYVSQDSYKEFLLSMSPYFQRVFVLSGNHEYDTYNPKDFPLVDEKIENICSMRNNLFYLQKKSFRLSEEENIHLIGCTLWSGLPKSKLELHKDHTLWISNMLFENPHIKYVVATHHCPLLECISQQKLPNYFASDQSELVSKSNVLQWIHGHSHRNRDFVYKNKWIVSNQYGKFDKPCTGYKT